MKIFVAGHQGMVGRAIVRLLEEQNLIDETCSIITRSRANLDLTNQADVHDFMMSERPDVIVIAAAKVGGIHANNTFPAEFIYQNLMIQSNLIHHAYLAGVKRLLSSHRSM